MEEKIEGKYVLEIGVTHLSSMCGVFLKKENVGSYVKVFDTFKEMTDFFENAADQ